MARTPEQILREIVAEQVFRIAQLASESEKLNDDIQKLTEENKKLTSILTGNSGEDK